MVAGQILGDELCIQFETFAFIYFQDALRPGKYKNFVSHLTYSGYVECDVSIGACRRMDTASYIQVHAVDLARRKVRISYDLRYYRLPSDVRPRDRNMPMSFRFTQTEPIVISLMN